MNKLNVIVALALVACLVVLECRADSESDDLAADLENEIADGDKDVDEGADGELQGKRIGHDATARWGYHDISIDGIGDVAGKRELQCNKSKSEAVCESCCSEAGKGYSYKKDVSTKNLRKGKIHTCTCYERTIRTY